MIKPKTRAKKTSDRVADPSADATQRQTHEGKPRTPKGHFATTKLHAGEKS